MISISGIGFHFQTEDEDFTRRMYVRWDDFYRETIHDIIEGVLSRQDKEGELIRLDKLELDLGDISQKEFYQQFPVRLREVLERTFSYASLRQGNRESEEERIQRRLASLLFYLEKGFCPTVWEDAEFHFGKEMDFLFLHAPHRLVHLFHDAVRQPFKLSRLLGGMQSEQLGRLMLLWLEDRNIPQDEKEMQLMELGKENYVLLPSLHKVADRIPVLSERLSVLLAEEKNEGYMSWLLSTTLSVYEKRRSLAQLLGSKPAVVLRFIHETSDEKSIRSLADLLDKVMVRQLIDTESENHTEVDVPDYWMYLYDWLIKNYPFDGVYMFGNKMQFKEYVNVKLLHFIRKRLYSAYLSKAELTVQFLMEVFGHEYYLEVLNIIYNQQQRNADGSPVYTGYFNMELYYMFLRLSLIKLPVGSVHDKLEQWHLPYELISDQFDFISIVGSSFDKDARSGMLPEDDTLSNKMSGEETLREQLLQENAKLSVVSMKWLGHLRFLLENDSISISEKRRVVALLMEIFRGESGHFVRMMDKYFLLANCMAVMDGLLLEQLVMRLVKEGSPQHELYMISFSRWMLAHEVSLAAFFSGGVSQLRESMVRVWTDWALHVSTSPMTLVETAKMVMIRLFGKENLTCVAQFLFQTLIQDLSVRAMPHKRYESERILNLLLRMAGSSVFAPSVFFCSRVSNSPVGLHSLRENGAESADGNGEGIELLSTRVNVMDKKFSLQDDFEKWFRHKTDTDSTFKSLCEKHLNNPANFIRWLEQTTFPAGLKRKVLQYYAIEYPYELVRLLQQCAGTPAFLSILTEVWSLTEIARFISRVSISKFAVLSQSMEILQQKLEFTAIIKATGKEWEVFFARALLLFLLDVRTFGQTTLHPQEIIRSWVVCLYASETGKATGPQVEESQWKQVEAMLAQELGVLSCSGLETSEDIVDLLNASSEQKTLRWRMAVVMEYHSGLLTDFLKKNADRAMIGKLAKTMDRALMEQLIILVSISGSPTHAPFFRKLMRWVMQRLDGNASEEILLCMLVLWMQAEGRENKTQEEMGAFLFWHLQSLLSIHPDTGINLEDGVFPFEWGGVKEYRQFSSALVAGEQRAKGEAGSVAEGKLPEEGLLQSPQEEERKESLSPVKLSAAEDDLANIPKNASHHTPNYSPAHAPVPLEEWNESIFVDWLKTPGISISVKQSILHHYLTMTPGRMLSLVRNLNAEGIVCADEWAAWFDEKDWMRMVAGISLYKAELLEQIMEYLLETQSVALSSLSRALVRFLLERDPENWRRETGSETIKWFMLLVGQWVDEKEGKALSVQNMIEQIKTELLISDNRQEREEELLMSAPEYILAGNAGVVLLTPWFPRLFGMLGLMNEEQKDFKDMAARIRAIFIIQRLVTFEEKEYEEKELAFNRILVACPFSEPLPAKLELTGEEMELVESMLNGVKENWTKVRNISIRGFQYNFIERSGRLEQKEEKWQLTVDPRSYDMLLDSVPWSYNRIRFPWLKKHIDVSWREKQEF